MIAHPFILIKQPTNSQMALSNQVKESVNQACNNLREALAFAARAEHSIVITLLTELIARCESMESMEEFMHQMENTKPSDYFKSPNDR